mmetsp:Transcript_1808/g.6467  ORF Transcript_1808/g.6467 Transcript_1808/m.6467 type:complete len:229 (+) Transcript_1808:591-1277(+)
MMWPSYPVDRREPAKLTQEFISSFRETMRPITASEPEGEATCVNSGGSLPRKSPFMWRFFSLGLFLPPFLFLKPILNCLFLKSPPSPDRRDLRLEGPLPAPGPISPSVSMSPSRLRTRIRSLSISGLIIWAAGGGGSGGHLSANVAIVQSGWWCSGLTSHSASVSSGSMNWLQNSHLIFMSSGRSSSWKGTYAPGGFFAMQLSFTKRRLLLCGVVARVLKSGVMMAWA